MKALLRGQDGGHDIPPQIREALADLDPGALPALAEFIVLHREFPPWAVWIPHADRPWIAVRPASARAPGPDLPLLWARAETATSLAGQHYDAADGQLSPP